MIIIFKSLINNVYSIKNYETVSKKTFTQGFEEIYFHENIETIVELLKELNRVIYGKDILNFISQKYLHKIVK